MSTVVVLAKAPLPGLVKTRLCPPLRPAEAAALAGAALRDTLDAALDAGAGRVVLALDGRLDPAPRGVLVMPQRGPDHPSRLAAAFADAGARAPGPVVLVGMDTPQVTPLDVQQALSAVGGPGDAALGPALDGGWWALALNDPGLARVLTGVPTSRNDTGERTRAALERHGGTVRPLRPLRDVDTWADALSVAAAAPRTRFAAALRALPWRGAAGAA